MTLARLKTFIQGGADSRQEVRAILSLESLQERYARRIREERDVTPALAGVVDAGTAPLDETATPLSSISEGGHTGAGIEAGFRQEPIAGVGNAGSRRDYISRDDLHE